MDRYGFWNTLIRSGSGQARSNDVTVNTAQASAKMVVIEELRKDALDCMRAKKFHEDFYDNLAHSISR